jgi:hypothetical protein
MISKIIFIFNEKSIKMFADIKKSANFALPN